VIVSVGVDTVEIARIGALWLRAGRRFLDRVYTKAEQDYCLARGEAAQSLAARFAAKEAVLKCLGTGWSVGLGFHQVEVVRNPRGAVTVVLHGAAAELATGRGIRHIHLSLTHDGGLATAFAVAED
jgi:holo-[acyl-carrier protein] synthase